MHSFDVSRTGDSVTVAPQGEIDWDTVLSLEPALEDAVAQGGLRRLVVDLTQVTFIDSSGINLLIQTVERCREGGIEPVLVKPELHVFHVFEVLGLQDVLPFAEQAPTA